MQHVLGDMLQLTNVFKRSVSVCLEKQSRGPFAI